MADAKLSTIYQTPTHTVTLTLSVEEAAAVLLAVGSIGGDHKQRELTSGVFGALMGLPHVTRARNDMHVITPNREFSKRELFRDLYPISARLHDQEG